MGRKALGQTCCKKPPWGDKVTVFGHKKKDRHHLQPQNCQVFDEPHKQEIPDNGRKGDDVFTLRVIDGSPEKSSLVTAIAAFAAGSITRVARTMSSSLSLNSGILSSLCLSNENLSSLQFPIEQKK